MAEISSVTPLMARVYPNGLADVNHFHAAGGLGYMIGELLAAGLLHEDVHDRRRPRPSRYTQEPVLEGDRLTWREGARESGCRRRSCAPPPSPSSRPAASAVLTAISAARS